MNNIFCYHNGYIVADTYNHNVYQQYCNFYNSHVNQLTNHLLLPVPLIALEFMKHCESDNDNERGRLVEPTMLRWLKPFGYETETLNTLLPDSDKKILIVAWLSLFNLSEKEMDKIFNDFNGHVIIDDSFECNPFRSVIYKKWLKTLGYNTSNVSVWTNGPSSNNELNFDEGEFRHNWLHLIEYARYRSANAANRITDLDDIAAAKAYANKKFQALFLNGHSTAQREYIMGLFAESGQTDKFLYSFRDPDESYARYFYAATSKNRSNYIPKVIDDDTDVSRSFVDRFKQDHWWNQSFYNINVETNCRWVDHNIRMPTEKWMKGVLYFTPSFMIGDYPEYEKYMEQFGFNNYSNYMDKSYDSVSNWTERSKALVNCVYNTGTPSQTQWQEMMTIAESNNMLLHGHYIPTLLEVFDDIITQITS